MKTGTLEIVVSAPAVNKMAPVPKLSESSNIPSLLLAINAPAIDAATPDPKRINPVFLSL